MDKRVLIYLALIAVGFYFGKYIGALGLVGLYLFFPSGKFRSNTAKKQQTQNRKNEQRKQREKQQKNRIIENKLVVAPLKWAYDILQVSTDTPWQTIEKRRKQLINLHHPDKLSQQASESEKQHATDNIQRINRAFAAIEQNKKHHEKN